MTQEEKQLLLKDLCARLPHGVVVNVEDDSDFDGWLRPYTTKLSLGLLQKYLGHSFSILPYLRPMSSMTDEEAEIINKLVYDKEDSFLSPISIWVINESDVDKYIDFCLSHHLDFRGLIPMSLALEAPEGMYKNE